MKVLISAAETSSDAHGAELLRALKRQAQVDAFGIGGPKLRKEGFRSLVDARELLAIGFGEAVGKLPRLYRALKEVSTEAMQEKPDVAVLIDYPEFHLKLAQRLGQLGVPVVCYIPPKVWIWRKHRVKKLKRLFARVLTILPFEEAFYADFDVPAKYVGNPLLDQLPLKLKKSDARARLALAGTDKVAVLMPGSRPAEFRQHTELLLDAASLTAKKTGFLTEGEKLHLLIPLPDTADVDSFSRAVDSWKEANSEALALLELHISQGNAFECMVAADAGLIKSGTSTLEAGMLGCPHAVIYKPPRLSEFIFKKIMRFKGPVGLVNLVYQGLPKPGHEWNRRDLMRELLCEHATPEALADELFSLFLPEKRRMIAEGIERLQKTVIGPRPERSPSEVAALEVLAVAREKVASRTQRSRGVT